MRKKEEKVMSKSRNKGLLKRMVLLFAMYSLFLSMSLSVYAEEADRDSEEGITALNQIMVATEAVEAKETPDQAAAVMITYEKDSTVFVTGETTDGWYRVSYQNITGYIPKEKLAVQTYGEELDQEFKAMEEESVMIVEEVERYRAEARRSKIWGAVIILLIIGIFATGIISTGKKDKEEANTGEEKLKVQKDIKVIDLDHEV